MAWPGGPIGSMCGRTDEIILDLNARVLANDVLAVRLVPIGSARQRFYAFFVNGQYTGTNYYVGLQDQDVLVQLTPGTTIGALWVEEAGHFPFFDVGTYVPSARAVAADAVTANKVLLKWSTTYSMSAVEGDSQIAVTSITGASRGINVTPIGGQTRGRLTYSITSVGTTRIVRWWNQSTLVAEGSRVGNGALTCSPINGSGLTVACTLTYSFDLPQNVSAVDLRWPSAYLINYSTSPLSFPRTAELTVLDNGKDDYVFPSPALANGTYNWTILERDDEGLVQTSGIPSTTPLLVNLAPDAPTITSVTGNAAALVVNWSGGSLGSFYTVYSSAVNLPVNYGRFPTPAPIVTAVNATTATLAAVTGYASYSVQSNIDTLEDAFDDEVDAMNAVFATGESGFTAQLATSLANLNLAVEAFGEAVGAYAEPQKAALVASFQNAIGREAFLSNLGLGTTLWQNDMALQYAPLLAFLGDELKHQPGRYTLPNGAIGGGAMGSATLGTGGNPIDGSSGLTTSLVVDSIEDLAGEVVRHGFVRIVVRATLGGVEETADKQVVVELDDSGNIVNPRPPIPNAISTAVTSLGGGNYQIAVVGQVLGDGNSVVPTTLNLFAAAPGGINLANPPQGTAALPTPVGGVQQATATYTVSSTGWYEVQLTTQFVSTQSFGSSTALVFVGGDGTSGVSNLRAVVTRGSSNLNGPGS